MLVVTALYLAIIAVGLIPINNRFEPSPDGIPLIVVSNAVHADIIVPVSTEVVDWKQEFRFARFGDDLTDKTHVAFGWGDRAFFVETPTWEDFRISNAIQALTLPTGSCLHVAFLRPEQDLKAESKTVTISEEQYRELVDFIRGSFVTDNQGDWIQIPDAAYSQTDAFFEARGRYHLLNTCNSWVGRGLANAGVRVPWFAPMPGTTCWYFPDP